MTNDERLNRANELMARYLREHPLADTATQEEKNARQDAMTAWIEEQLTDAGAEGEAKEAGLQWKDSPTEEKEW